MRRERTYIVSRRLDKKTCVWFDPGVVFEPGAIVYEFIGHTYGCVGSSGIAITRQRGNGPFLELPRDALELIPDEQVAP